MAPSALSKAPLILFVSAISINNEYFNSSMNIRLTKMHSQLSENGAQNDRKFPSFCTTFLLDSDCIFVNLIFVDKIKYSLFMLLMQHVGCFPVQSSINLCVPFQHTDARCLSTAVSTMAWIPTGF